MQSMQTRTKRRKEGKWRIAGGEKRKGKEGKRREGRRGGWGGWDGDGDD